MRSASELLPQVYRKLTRAGTDEEALLIALWPGAVGEKLASRTRPVRLFGDVLIVETDAQSWRKELARMAAEIVKRLNAAAGTVILRDVEFRAAAAPRPPGRARFAAPASAEEHDEAAAITDPHLRRLYRLSRRQRDTK
jgi:predicted nucleic acid-binding Zn ribbon protein